MANSRKGKRPKARKVFFVEDSSISEINWLDEAEGGQGGDTAQISGDNGLLQEEKDLKSEEQISGGSEIAAISSVEAPPAPADSTEVLEKPETDLPSEAIPAIPEKADPSANVRKSGDSEEMEQPEGRAQTKEAAPASAAEETAAPADRRLAERRRSGSSGPIVYASDLADGSVSEAKLASASVSRSKLQPGSVSSEAIADGP